MAVSACPKCESPVFELKTVEPKGSAYKLSFVQCASCGAVVGVMDYFNIGAKIEEQNQALIKIAKALNVHL
jgi:hypothetical protein